MLGGLVPNKMLACLVSLALTSTVLTMPMTSNDKGYSYFCVGNCKASVAPEGLPGLVLMGGGTDVDAAFKWMVAKAQGGDFVVLRSTGTDAYNEYIFEQISNKSLNSV